MQGTGQPRGGAATSALLTAWLLSADSRAVSGTFKTDLPKGAFPAHHHPAACQQHTLLRCSELGREQGGLTRGWQSRRERTRTRCQDVDCLPGPALATAGVWHCMLPGSLGFLVAQTHRSWLSGTRGGHRSTNLAVAPQRGQQLTRGEIFCCECPTLPRQSWGPSARIVVPELGNKAA